ncbi:MAG TPA: type II toxin-antitoxin system PemK/MazF family toxin [Nocardioidaceae bacterium]|nr:type II toxin-antitoxin system PemK/MazF family toxin [Nocardioidaceae bacterium]
MRDIHVAHLDKARPVLVLTRDSAREVLGKVTVAPITSTVKGLSTEVRLGPRNGLDQECVASCDNILTIDKRLLGRHVGLLLDDQEPALARAVLNAFALTTA